MEKQELKHIQHYPIGTLKVICPNNCIGVVVSIITTDPFVEIGKDTEPDPVLVRVMYEDGINKPKYDFETLGISQIKPILRPMSDLWKVNKYNLSPLSDIALLISNGYIGHTQKYTEDLEIKVNDNSVTIMTRIGICGNAEPITIHFKDSRKSEIVSITRFSNKQIMASTYIKVLNYLFSHHFDVFGLIPELAIDINTVKQ